MGCATVQHWIETDDDDDDFANKLYWRQGFDCRNSELSVSYMCLGPTGAF
jgi:hypothetical protein